MVTYGNDGSQPRLGPGCARPAWCCQRLVAQATACYDRRPRVPGRYPSWPSPLLALTPRLALDELDERLFNFSMGRIAGVTAAETRERLLQAAAEVFAARGYDGTRVADIAAAAGVSNGALYAHFSSKADLLDSALRTHGRRHLADTFAADPGRSITDLLLEIGRWLPRRRDAGGYLIVEALVAARHDADVALPMRHYMAERADWLGDLMRAAQAGGEIDPVLSPTALAHFCLLLAMGSALVTPDLHAVDDHEWATLLSRVVTAFAETGTTAQTGTST
jgi:AcrR family transcriptional regulator